MDILELKTHISRGEDSTQQFKENINHCDSLAAEMVAFSNAQGGTIFIGISNNGELKGISIHELDRINQLISNAANQHVRSPITIQTTNISISADRIVIVLSVPEGIDKPYFDHFGVIWLKSAADKRRINSKEELRRLFQEVELLYADEVPTKAGKEALDTSALSIFVKNVYNETLPKSALEIFKFLENMNLASNNRLNLAGLLLFGQKPQLYKPAFIIKAARFSGTEIDDQYLDSEDFEGTLSILFQGTVSFITRNLRKVQKDKGVNSIGELEIPLIVFEELLVNALIHRDYFITAPIRLFIFDDRIEIINPGNLSDHLTIEKIRVGNSIQRNPILASFVAKGLLPYRGLGTGIRRALKDWPKIDFIDDRNNCIFTTIIKRMHENTESIKDTILTQSFNNELNIELSDLQKQIIKYMRDNSLITYDELAVQLNKEKSTIKRNIQLLKSLGVVQRAGAKKKGYWVISNEL